MNRRDHRDLIVWQKALVLAEHVHRITLSFPNHERFGLAGQLRRAAVSIPSNVAEGAARASTREFIQFLHVARGSLAELETQIHLAAQFGYLSQSQPLLDQLQEVGRLLNAVIRGLRRKVSQGTARRAL